MDIEFHLIIIIITIGMAFAIKFLRLIGQQPQLKNCVWLQQKTQLWIGTAIPGS